MTNSLSLYSIQDSDGKRLIAKYYTDGASFKPDFEKNLFAKSKKVYEDILLFERHLVCYRNVNDVFIYVIGDEDENELFLENILSLLANVLQRLVKGQFAKKSLVDRLDVVLLLLDELVDDGILLETSVNTLYDTVAGLIKNQENTIELSLTEQSISQALAMAKEQLTRSLLK